MNNDASVIEQNRWVLPLSFGITSACAATLGLRHFGLWVPAAAVGAAVCLGSLLARDFQCYWIAVYALVLPLEIKKMLADSAPVREFVLQYGFPVGEPPGPILYLSDLALVVLLAHWAVEILTKRRRIVIPSSNIAAAALLGWAALSLTNAASVSSSVFELVRMFKLYALYLYAANNIVTSSRLKTLIGWLLLGAAAQGLLCAGQFLARDKGFLATGLFGGTAHLPAERTKQIGSFFAVSAGGGRASVRASGTAGASDAEAQYFEFLIPVAFGLWVGASRTLRKKATIALVSGLAGLVLTFSRGGLLGLTTGLAAALVLSYRYRLLESRRFAGWCLAGCTGLVIATPLLYQYLTTRPEAVIARVHLNRVGVEMMKAHPITGVGLNNHLVVKSAYDSERYVIPLPTHNQYILMASQIGIPGALLFLILILCFIRACLRGCGSADRFSSAVSVGLVGGIVAVSVHGLADYVGTYTNNSLLWLYGGLGEVLGSARRAGHTLPEDDS